MTEAEFDAEIVRHLEELADLLTEVPGLEGSMLSIAIRKDDGTGQGVLSMYGDDDPEELAKAITSSIALGLYNYGNTRN